MNIQEWKAAIRDRIQQSKELLSEAAPYTTYGFMATMSLLPIAIAAGQGQLAAIATLGSVVGGVGGNLIANQLEAWKGRSDAEIAADLQERAKSDPEWRTVLDTLLTELQTPTEAEAVLTKEEWTRMADQLRAELVTLKSSLELTPHGQLVSASGERSAAVGGDNDGTIITGDQNVIIYAQQFSRELLDKIAPNQQPKIDLPQTTERYLTYLLNRYRYLDFKGMGMADRVALQLAPTIWDQIVPALTEADRWRGRRVCRYRP